jgi:hypothetical protein
MFLASHKIKSGLLRRSESLQNPCASCCNQPADAAENLGKAIPGEQSKGAIEKLNNFWILSKIAAHQPNQGRVWDQYFLSEPYFLNSLLSPKRRFSVDFPSYLLPV